MNTLKATLCTTMVLGATLLIAKPALATQFVAADSSPGTQACMAVAANKSYVVRKASRDLNISKAVMSKKLNCNNLSMGDFVTLYNLDKSANYLNIDTSTRTSIKDLAKSYNPEKVIITGPK
ncbi:MULTISPECIES: DUF3718 domain-containing protein [unclassified Pseudoalteromonas]|uniref:DUF3718 domain-containing protein n=1 Tax=unclassified Pseudoalteromonas TaxID=194690 RepID=UPI00257BBFFB|nr:DUF3718 domain-containing protein [Pseudoalteromonas sp. UBA2102]|tara:strand:- start:2623 stop:2988 length:366 start_codon:yes stop_codon:yes gene_type:complete